MVVVGGKFEALGLDDGAPTVRTFGPSAAAQRPAHRPPSLAPPSACDVRGLATRRRLCLAACAYIRLGTPGLGPPDP